MAVDEGRDAPQILSAEADRTMQLQPGPVGLCGIGEYPGHEYWA